MKEREEILNEITSVCENCKSHENCQEEECVLYRIEEIVVGGIIELKDILKENRQLKKENKQLKKELQAAAELNVTKY